MVKMASNLELKALRKKMQPENMLFRSEALDKVRSSWLSEVILIRPISFTFISAFAAAVSMLIISFFYFGTYTKKNTLNGQIIPDNGFFKVYANQSGVILSKKVREGNFVDKGEIL